jgi:predicted  nucleic acid-binding Zn-ribbon protein
MTQVTEVSELLKRFDALAADIQTIKFSQVRTEEQIKSLSELTDQRITDLDKSLNRRIDSLETSLNKRIDSVEQRGIGQETRFWGLVAILATALLGIIGKVVFFPVDNL